MPPMDIGESIGDRCKRIRESLGMSQPALAKAAGVSNGTIGNLEAGLRKQPRELVAIARALGVTPEWLQYGAQGGKIAPPQAAASATHEKFSDEARIVAAALDTSIPAARKGDAMRAALKALLEFQVLQQPSQQPPEPSGSRSQGERTASAKNPG